jgi:hypothetical protein
MSFGIEKLIVYRNFVNDEILKEVADIIREFEADATDRDELISRIYNCINKLLAVSTENGFDHNLWQNYLTYLLVMDENPFALSCEKEGDRGGSVVSFVLGDFAIIKGLFHYDFAKVEEELGISCFSVITNYKAIKKADTRINKNVSDKVKDLSRLLNAAKDENEFYERVTEFYKTFGVGKFGLNKSFRISEKDGSIIPITNTVEIRLHELVGYEIQKEKLIANTKAFVDGKRANNCLLYGDAGTGKSSSVKAVLNRFYPDGLRMIEIYKHQFVYLSEILSQIKNRNYRFIIYMDDLSFEEFETEYKYLKAVIEGGLEVRPENVLIYATSNRRHLIRELWSDRTDMEHNQDVHRSDTMQEKLSLADRFGITIGYFAPNQNEYFDIVSGIAGEYPELKLDEKELHNEARKWEIANGGRSGRTARQFVDYLLGSKQSGGIDEKEKNNS